MLFKDMKLGTEFYSPDGGSGEYDLFYYKVTDTEAVCVSRSNVREKMSTADDYPVTGKVYDIHTEVTDIEACALRLLYEQTKYHPALDIWVNALINNPNELRDIGEYVLEYEREPDGINLVKFLNEKGFIAPRERFDRNFWGAIYDEKPMGETYKDGTREAWEARRDAAALKLAHAVHIYRETGRVSETTTQIMGMGAPLMNVTTSLAAKICEFHISNLNIAHHEMTLKQRQLDSVKRDLKNIVRRIEALDD